MRFQDQSGDENAGAMLQTLSGDEDNGYMSPEFDLPPLSGSEEEEYFKDVHLPTKKKRKVSSTKDDFGKVRPKFVTQVDALQEDEDLALQLLNGR